MEKQLRIVKQAILVNEGKHMVGDCLIEGDKIAAVAPTIEMGNTSCEVIDGSGKYLIPGLIDTHVHFREPGLTHKGDIHSESRAAVAGGVTTYMDMPNVKPLTTTLEHIEEKEAIAQKESVANYGFYLGLTNDNIDYALSIDETKYCALKLFLGSSTGNMLVNAPEKLEHLFKNAGDRLIAVHSEDEDIIRRNRTLLVEQYGEGNVPISEHPRMRSEEACVKATSQIIALAKKYNTRLHILHLTTAKELEMVKEVAGCSRITAETCPQYLYFNDGDYKRLGARIKCNPAIKTRQDQEALIAGLMDGGITTIGTDHAPHLLEEKAGDCLKAASGAPEIQFGVLVLMELVKQGKLSMEKLVELTAHNPAKLYKVEKRGFIKEGYQADLALIDPHSETKVTKETILSKCGWSPYEGVTFSSSVALTMVNGEIVWKIKRE